MTCDRCDSDIDVELVTTWPEEPLHLCVNCRFLSDEEAKDDAAMRERYWRESR